MEKVSDQYLRLFIDQAPVSIAMFDREMRYLAASDALDDNTGFRVKIILGRSHYDVVPGIARTLESGAPERSCRRDHSGRGRRV